MQMSRQGIQVLQNESVKFIDRIVYFKIILAGDLPVLRTCVPARSMLPLPEKT